MYHDFKKLTSFCVCALVDVVLDNNSTERMIELERRSESDFCRSGAKTIVRHNSISFPSTPENPDPGWHLRASATAARITAMVSRFPSTADISQCRLSPAPSGLTHSSRHETFPVITCSRFVKDSEDVLRCWDRSGSRVTPNNLISNSLALTRFIAATKHRIKTRAQLLSCVTYFD